MDEDGSRSKKLYERALRVLPGGVSRNAVLRSPHPLYAAKGDGCYLTDVDGVRRIDFANNVASLIHGHAHPVIVEAVTKQLQLFSASTFSTELVVRFAEHLVQRSESFDKVRFVNSGTEAVMSCLKAARAYTGRPKIAKVEGAYHGLYDYAEVSQTANPSNWGEPDCPNSVPVAHGTPKCVLGNVVVIPFNDPETAVAILDRHAEDLACVLVDPLPHRVGLTPATKEYIETLWRWTRKNGALLVYDEVITFRSEYGGAQQWYEVRPDLTALGKIIGGGFAIGAIAGTNEAMEVLNPLAKKVLFPHSGTFSANPITMTAGLTAMELLDREAVAKLNALSKRAFAQIAEAIAQSGVQACVAGAGSMFRIHLKPQVPQNFREAYANPEETRLLNKLIDYMFDNGIMLINSCSGTITTPMTQKEIDTFCEMLLAGLRKLKEMPAELAAVEKA